MNEQFAERVADLWQPLTGDWEWNGGKLRQRTVQNGWAVVLCTKPVPADAVISTRFRVTDGQQYKSLGLAFDAADADNLQGVYLSVSGKVQLFQRVKGADSYPTHALKMRPIEAGREYTLKIATRGRLVNVWVDAAFHFSVELPADRPAGGKLGLVTYDAAAEFSTVQATSLPGELALRNPDGQPATAPSVTLLQDAVADAERKVGLAERRLATATAARVW
ncbi:MAG: hypothetical protein ACKOJF_02400, partial [Planctomycetaceae bacterium]